MSDRRPRLLCVAANPSIDRLVEVDRLELGRIHRPDRVRPVAGGKGLNLARAAARLGADVTACALLAGHAGRWIADELERAGIAGRHAWAGGETRTCVSILSRADGTLTEVYEPGEGASEGAWATLAQAVGQELANRPDAMTISGSLPVGVPADAYARLVGAARAAGVPVFVDVHGEPLLLALAEGPSVVKVNVHEADELIGGVTDDAAGARAAARAIRDIGAVSAIVTLGARGAAAVVGGTAELLLGAPPGVGPYSVGSGDAFLAGMAVARAGGASWTEALRLGGAAGAANALVPGAGELDPLVARELAERIVVEPFPAA